MKTERFSIGKLNSHYDGAYSEQMKAWRRLGARDKAANIRSLTGHHIFQALLEVGCGTGSVLAQLSEDHLARQFNGIDMADPELHRDERATGIDLRQYNGTNIPFEDNTFDLVVSTHVVEHVPDPRGFIAELIRVSSDYVYIEVPCELTLRANTDRLQPSVNTGHINLYTPESFLLLLQTSGLEVEKFELFDHSIEVLGFPNSPIKGQLMKFTRSALLAINPFLASRLFTYHCGALCRAV
jgi:SAM-dependent methyltransferase